MPAIRKIRIVNFRFNNGAKLIPDEIFCTENAEGKPIDTLFNLDNGGGKSVIVQLLLQPICPKAKVQNRNISDYFQKGTDHAFVLIEWALDGSHNSLLTGIALAASTTADDENESKTIRYYTFIHDYTRAGDKLDLISLPLSQRTGSHIRPISFDELRKYLQNRRVEYYPSDSLRRYQKRLEEFGIFHNEWENILVPINAVEGGITKFFEEYKTSDRLLDKFIIPGVMPSNDTSTRSLEEMFINYAVSYAGQEKNLLLKSQIRDFTDKLQGMLQLIKDMWNAEDQKIQSIHQLADHSFTLQHQIKLNKERQQQLEKAISDLKTKQKHIKTEAASKAVYLSQADFDKSTIWLAECKQKKDDAESQYNRLEHKVKVLNAAKEYKELLKQQNDEKALTAQIRELDQGTQDSHILSLKYSLSLLTTELIRQTEGKLKQKEATKKELSEALDSIKEEISRLKKQHDHENDSLNQDIGQKKSLLDQINKALATLALHMTIMLDGSFSKKDAESIRADYDEQLRLAEENIKKCLLEESRLEQERDAQDNQMSELHRTQEECKANLKQQEAELKEYQHAYDAVIKVLEHLSISKDRLFTDEPLSSLEQILAKLREQLRQTERCAELLSEQLRCINAGQLHLSKTAVSFLQESGIAYQTGEQYLNLQNAKIREDILTVNPLVAYSVIVDSEKEKVKLLSQSPDSWLSAVVPVYSRSELADMADGDWNEPERFISAYDKEYFQDAFTYKENIQKRLGETQADIYNLQHQISEWESERSILSQFTYAADHEQQLQADIDKLKEKLQEIQTKLSVLEKQKSEIKARTKENRQISEKSQISKSHIENKRSEFERICKIISQYESVSEKIIELETICREISEQIDGMHQKEKQLNKSIQDNDIIIRDLQNKLTDHQKLSHELKDTPKAEILTEDHSVMLEEYRLYLENNSANRKTLQKRLEQVQESIVHKENDIKRFHIEPTEYKSTEYSANAYNDTEQQLDLAKEARSQAYEQHSQASSYHTKVKNDLEHAKKKLAELNAELLPRSEVGSDFERRIKECENKLEAAERESEECKKELNGLDIEWICIDRCKKDLKLDFTEYTPKISEIPQDTDNLIDTIKHCIDQLTQAEDKAKKYHSRELEPFRNTHTLFIGTLDGILSVIDDDHIKGDKYFTLYERTESDIKRYQDRIAQLAVQLKDVEDSKKQLVDHCKQRAGRLYDNLKTLSGRSVVQIGNVKKHMIQIVLPEIDPDSDQPYKRIDHFITEQVQKHLSEKTTATKTHNDHLDIRRLLNCYIGNENIPINVFKIDKNIQNCRYRSWQDALKANSGGEQFVVLFSLIVSVMNYTRSLTNNLNSTSGVLILDNPFGPISSPHLLEPMFRIARHFHIQLICLTHLGTAAVTSFFDMVYQLRFKNLPLSNVEILETEAKQHMEHAFYLSEQLSLF